MAASIPNVTFNNGYNVPGVGLGCWMGQQGAAEETYAMVRTALQLGYRHFDTAFGYGNEEAVGRAIRESGIPRSEIFVTTKLTNSHHASVAQGFDMSFKNLNIEYIDLYLMHWPNASDDKGSPIPYGKSPTFVETWKDMEKLLGTGKVRSLGVSNFSIKIFEELLPHATVIPVTNQVECNVYYPQHKLQEYCKSKGITITAYGPLGQYQNTFLTDPEVVKVAEKNKVTTAQIAISWLVQRGIIPVPKSSNAERLKQNITLLTLSKEDFDTIDNLHKQPGKHRSLDRFTNRVHGSIAGWTMEQMGWKVGKDGYIEGDD
ncbi:Aldo/keto reductase [Calocera viscosa TUFC12733]|uniref:Aldo/keto reductase n=1 Tax=Calocera viscosa (strain TUFC12733) TaxID=1330018 RepID=A0A167HCC8_CALVF|nr:Aldo/keto reductase [Calocera viscosa TUFC12733]